MKQIWSEKYRPKTVNEYVFRDESLKKQVNSWIKDKSIPHLLITGPAGTGKCLGGNELIDIEIDVSTLTEKQISMLSKYKSI